MIRPHWAALPASSQPSGANGMAWRGPPQPDMHAMLLLEHLLDRTNANTETLHGVASQLGSMSERLQTGDQVHREIRADINRTKARVRTLESKIAKPADEMGTWEKWLKILGPWLLPLAVLAMTGSIDAALKAVAH